MSHNDKPAGFVYVMFSNRLLGKVLQNCSAAEIKNIDDKGCRVFKIGKAADVAVRQKQLASERYAGTDDWGLLHAKNQTAAFAFEDALKMEQKFHRFLRRHKKFTHMTAEKFPWLACDSKNNFVEVYYGPVSVVEAFVSKFMQSLGSELKALSEARRTIERQNRELGDAGRRLVELRQRADRFRAAEDALSSELRRSTANAEVLKRDLDRAADDVVSLRWIAVAAILMSLLGAVRAESKLLQWLIATW